MDRIRRLVMQVLDQHKEEFTTDFTANKRTLDQLAVVRSKGLKNEMAGYITKFMRRESDSKAQKQQREARAAAEAQEQQREARSAAEAQEQVGAEETEQETILEETVEESEPEDVEAEQDDSEQEEIVMENKPQE